MIKSVDDVLLEIDGDIGISSLLRVISDLLDDRNYFAMREITRLRLSELESDLLVKAVKEVHAKLVSIINKNKRTFFDSDAESKSGRLDYKYLLFCAKDKNNNVTEENLSDWIIISLLGGYRHNIDDYVSSMSDTSLPKNKGLSVDKDGLVSLNNNRITVRKHALQFDDGSLLFLHPFLRRFFTANFVDMPAILSYGISQGYDTSARVDPYRNGNVRYYNELEERDYWHGAHFDKNVLDSKDKKELWTVHGLDETDDRVKALSASYPISQTHFRTSMMDDNLRQFSIEEYTPRVTAYGKKSPNFGKKYYIQKYAHFVYDQTGNFIQHVDCSVRVFKIDDYLEIYDNVRSGNDPGRQIGKRYKLFKISGALDLEFVQSVLYEFFRYNVLIDEYFSNKTFDEVWDYLQN